jgi:hypothetical protein
LLASFIKEFLNVDPAIEAVMGLRQMRIGPRLKSLRQIRLTAALIQELYQKFISDNNINPQERREIARDAAKKLASLALQASRFDTQSFILLSIQALKLDYRLLYPSAIMSGVESYFRNRVSEKRCTVNP